MADGQVDVEFILIVRVKGRFRHTEHVVARTADTVTPGTTSVRLKAFLAELVDTIDGFWASLGDNATSRIEDGR